MVNRSVRFFFSIIKIKNLVFFPSPSAPPPSSARSATRVVSSRPRVRRAARVVRNAHSLARRTRWDRIRSAATVDVPSSAAADLPPRGDASLPPRRVARRRRRPPSLVEREKTPRRSRLLECSTPRASARFTSVPFARCSSRVESCRVVSCFLRGGLRWSTAVVAIASSPPILLVSESSSLLVHPSPSPAARGGRGSPFFLLCFVCVVLRI